MELTGRAEATKVQAIGLAEAKATEALGLARAIGFEAQTKALGSGATAVVAVANAVSEGHLTVVPEVLVTGGGGGGGSIDGLAATLMRHLSEPEVEAGGTATVQPEPGIGSGSSAARGPPREPPQGSRRPFDPAPGAARRRVDEPPESRGRPRPGISVTPRCDPPRVSIHVDSNRGGHIMDHHR